MRDFTTNRSNAYQHLFAEIVSPPEKLVEFSDAQDMAGLLNYSEYKEERLDLQEKLNSAYWRLIDTKLTPRQRQVLHLTSDGYTQTEIAKALGVNQSSITKSINGNCDYKNGRKIYGGAKKKLQILAKKDTEVQSILRQMAELNDEKY
jgi:FixJ family two-component response regulator